jgi:hypothetical protein
MAQLLELKLCPYRVSLIEVRLSYESDFEAILQLSGTVLFSPTRLLNLK